MRERLERRLIHLRTEFQEGQKTIADLELKLNNLRTTVLRISGAIQVLEEELANTEGDRPNDRKEETTEPAESVRLMHAG
jgi:uncharacterized coiled-coil protein SlyX